MFLPILVDRFVTFLYTGHYSARDLKAPRVLDRATHIPFPSTKESYACPDLNIALFHLHMCGMAEALEPPALYDYAYSQLSDALTKPWVAPTVLKKIIDIVFSAPDSSLRVGKDKDGWIKNLVVAGPSCRKCASGMLNTGRSSTRSWRLGTGSFGHCVQRPRRRVRISCPRSRGSGSAVSKA
jgi:hypothetical protein